jgi:hypothetical protein
MTGDTFEKIKKGVKDTAEKITDSAEKVADPDTYTGSDEEKEVNRQNNEAGGKEPMNPEEIRIRDVQVNQFNPHFFRHLVVVFHTYLIYELIKESK